jgi:hypothetical protein
MDDTTSTINATPQAEVASNTIELTHIRDNDGKPFFKDGDYFFYLSAGEWSRTVNLSTGLVEEVSPHSVSIRDDANGTLLAGCRAYLANHGKMVHTLRK